MAAFVLVHGAGAGAWFWARTCDDLGKRGHTSIAVDLPLTTLDDDVAALRQTLDSIDESTIVVGSSYGGLVISSGTEGRSDVRHLVYVSAFMLERGDIPMTRLAEFPAAPVNDRMEFSTEGYYTFSEEAAVECFFNECDLEVATQAAKKLRPMSAAWMGTVMGTAVDAEPWRVIPSTYVVCTRDRAHHPQFQRWMSTHADTVVEFDTDHCPSMSAPQEFVELLDRIGRSAS